MTFIILSHIKAAPIKVTEASRETTWFLHVTAPWSGFF
jgi:hypothetical protein